MERNFQLLYLSVFVQYHHYLQLFDQHQRIQSQLAV